MDALPPDTFTGAIQLTVQGEGLEAHYSNLATGTYQLELLVAGALAIATINTRTQINGRTLDGEARAAMTKLSDASNRAYRALLEAKGFLEFHAAVTPDASDFANFGSRPARHKGRGQKKLSLDNLRAISWTFGWMQSRYYLPGWFGAGSALEVLLDEDDEEFERFARLARRHPFLRYLFSNMESSLVSASLDRMREYADLCEDKAVRERIFTQIREEYERTQRMLNRLFGSPFDERRPRMRRTIDRREQLLTALHHHQIGLLRRWHQLERDGQLRDDDGNLREEHRELYQAIVQSVAAISHALRNTG